MATVINTPETHREIREIETDSGAGMGMVLGIIVAVILGALFFIYGLPYLRSSLQTANPDINLNINTPAPLPTPTPSP